MSRLSLYLAETDDFSPDVLQYLRINFDVSLGPKRVPLKTILNSFDVFWFRLNHKIDSNVLDNASRCRYIVCPATGLDHIDEELCSNLGVQIISLRGEVEFLKEIRATAEHTLGLAMALIRNIPDAVYHVKNGGWNRDLFRGTELYCKKAGIVGYGRLGRLTAQYFRLFGCEVGYFDVEDRQHSDQINQYTSLNKLLQESDIVSIHVPLNEETRHLFSFTELSQMKENAVLINTSRGDIIDESALLEVLKKGKIAGAALDVLTGEPHIQRNPLVRYAARNSNLIITPHIGGNTYESFHKTEKFVAEKLVEKIEATKKW